MSATAVAHLHDENRPANPFTLLQAARRQFSEVESWLLSEEAMNKPLDEIEREQERRMREANRLLLQAHILARGTGDRGPSLRLVPQPPRAPEVILKGKGERPRHPKTIFGEIEVRRRAYMAAGQASVYPLDEDLALSQRQFSYELQRRAVEAAVQGPFEEVLQRIEGSTGQKLSKRSAEQFLQDAAQDFDAFYEKRAAPDPRTTGSIVVGSVDSKGIPMVKPEPAKKVVRRGKGEKANKKRMATVATAFTQSPRVRTPQEVLQSLFEPQRKLVGQGNAPPCPRPQHKRVWASLKKGKDAVITQVGQEMKRRDPEGTKTHVVVTDGERALQIRAERIIGGIVGRLIVVLDFLHVLESLWKAAHVVHKEGTAEAEEWVRQRALRILRGEVSQVVKGMRQSATKQGLQGAKRKVIDDVSGYFYRNRRRMRYQEYLAKGLPIASGAVEGACKNLVKDRMERPGMRWTEEGAEAMLKLRAIERTGDFKEYWAFHVRADQERLHPQGRWSAVHAPDEK